MLIRQAKMLAISALFISTISITDNRELAHKAKSKIAIISLYNEGYRKVGQYSDWNKKAYAKKHGYDLILYHKILDTTRPPAWSKILAIQENLAEYEWIYWSDADSLIMNTETKLESIIDNNYDMILTKEDSGPGNLNTGSFLLKNSPWSQQLLTDIYQRVDFINAPAWEQAAFMHLLATNESYNPHVKILKQRVMNSHLFSGEGEYKTGDFVLHFYGSDQLLINIYGKPKAGLMKQYYDVALSSELQRITKLPEKKLRDNFHTISKQEKKFIKTRKLYHSALISLINAHNLKIGAEIGVGFGIQSQAILLKTKVNKLYCVDPYKDTAYEGDIDLSQSQFNVLYFKMGRMLDVFNERAELIRGPSAKVAREFDANELDFVWIDLNLSTSENINEWFKKVRRGGIIAGYGYSKDWPDTKKTVKRFFKSKNLKLNIDEEHWVWWVIKS